MVCLQILRFIVNIVRLEILGHVVSAIESFM